jgi:hypothetical protein
MRLEHQPMETVEERPMRRVDGGDVLPNVVVHLARDQAS